MNRFKGRAQSVILRALCAVLAVTTVVLTVLCVRAARDLKDALDTRDDLSRHAGVLRDELDSLNAELASLESEKRLSEEELDDKTARIESLEEIITGLHDEQEQLNGENGELSAKLEEANRVADTLREDVDALSRRIDAKREAAAVLRERSRALQDTVDALEGELSDTQDALAGKKTELRDAKREIVSARSELNSAKTALSDTKDELEDTKSELNDTKTELKDAKSALKDTQAALAASGRAAPTAEAEPKTAVAPAAPSAKPAVSYDGLNDAEKALLQYIDAAPDRWDWLDGGTKLAQIPSTVAYYTASIDGSESLAYNADTVLYAASLIKAPYIYSVLTEIEAFEATAARDGEGKIVYRDGEEKYNLDAEWVYDPAVMTVAGSGEIAKEEKGFSLTWRELFEYALLYSDNIAFKQIYDRFGFASFNGMVWRLGIQGQSAGFMYLTARDCGKFLAEIYRYFESGTEYARWMKDLMTRSKYGEMIAVHYPAGTVAHKYGWDTNSFHDMAIVDGERPYVLVVMTDYEDGGNAAFSFFATVVELTKAVYASK